MAPDLVRKRGEHPVITEELLIEFIRRCDSVLAAVANSQAFSMRTFVATVASGDAFSCAVLDRLPRARYEDFMCEMTRAGWELHGYYLARTPVMIVKQAPKEARP